MFDIPILFLIFKHPDTIVASVFGDLIPGILDFCRKISAMIDRILEKTIAPKTGQGKAIFYKDILIWEQIKKPEYVVWILKP
jgi:hypothetical protein